MITTSKTTVHADWDMVSQILSRIIPPTFPVRNFNITSYGATNCYLAFTGFTNPDPYRRAGFYTNSNGYPAWDDL